MKFLKLKLLIPIFVMVLLAFTANAFVISGIVTDTNTNPINNSLIQVYDSSNVLVNSTTTNATGQYSLEVGNLLRVVNCSAASYDPQSTPVFVSSDTVVNFALGPIQSVTLDGYVRDNASSPLTNVDVVVAQSGATFTQTVTDGAGYYSVNVIDANTYDVSASLATYDSSTQTVTISGNTTQDFTLTQTPTCTDNDGDGYGDGCALGTDFDDSDPSKYPGAPCSRTCYSGSTYDVNGVCTGGSYTCSSGGGGGGGGSSYSGTDYTFDIDPGDSIIKELRRKDTVTFDYEGEEHTVTINNVYSSGVSVTVSSNPITEIISIFQTKGFNFDGDLANDFMLTLNSVSGDSAELEFKLKDDVIIPDLPITTPQQPATQPDVVDEGPHQSGNAIRIIVEDEKRAIENSKQDTEDKKSSSGIGVFFKNILNKILYLKYILAGVALLAVLILIFSLVTRFNTFNKTEKRSNKKEETLEKIKELQSQIKEMKRSL